MSDFIFSSKAQNLEKISRCLRDVSIEEDFKSYKFQGTWGSMVVKEGPYKGFSPVETNEHICIVVGGPVLYWRKNDFLTGKDEVVGTREILDRWKQKALDFSEDLSGPFVIFIVNKITSEIICITDLLMFIPAYKSEVEGFLTLGTHVDAVAQASGKDESWDEVSIADFVLHHAVTHPYTVYQDVWQLDPGTIHSALAEGADKKNKLKRYQYWIPLEKNNFKNIDEAASALREGLGEYVDRVTEDMEEVGHFISAGEDSRSLCGLLPKRLKRKAYIFLDSMNREGNIARKVAKAYGCEFNLLLRSPIHYLEILSDANRLIGGGQQYTHAHTLRLADIAGLKKFPAVFGGYASDTLLKSLPMRLPPGLARFPFIPEFTLRGESQTASIKYSAFGKEVNNKIQRRRLEHMSKVRDIRPETCHEWFTLWPMSMRMESPNLSANRRLFASYEIFTSKEVVKVSAAVPRAWKLNRRLFNKAMRPALKNTWWIRHGDGRFPYFPWWVNSFLQIPPWFIRNSRRVFKLEGNQGPWNDWKHVSQSYEWEQLVKKNKISAKLIPTLNLWVNQQDLLEREDLNIIQKVNFIQAIEAVAALENAKPIDKF